MMLKNRDLPSEVKAIILSATSNKAELGRKLGVSRQAVDSIFMKKMIDGEESWIRALDACGYDVEVRIKKRKVE